MLNFTLAGHPAIDTKFALPTPPGEFVAHSLPGMKNPLNFSGLRATLFLPFVRRDFPEFLEVVGDPSLGFGDQFPVDHRADRDRGFAVESGQVFRRRGQRHGFEEPQQGTPLIQGQTAVIDLVLQESEELRKDLVFDALLHNYFLVFSPEISSSSSLNVLGGVLSLNSMDASFGVA